MSTLQKVSINTIGNASYAFAQLIIVAMISRYKGLEQVGLFSLALAIMNSLQLAILIDLRTIQSRYYDGKYKFGCYLRVRIISVIAFIIVSISISLLYYERAELFLILLAAAFLKVAEGMGEVVFGYYQSKEQFTKITSIILYRSIMILSVMSLMLYLDQDLYICMAFAAVPIIFGSIININRLASTLGWKCNDGSGINIVKESWTIGLYTFIGSLMVSLPRIYIENDMGAEILGLYTLAMIPPIGVLLVTGSIGQAFSSKLSVNYDIGSEEYLKILRKSLKQIAIVVLLSFVIYIAILPIYINVTVGAEVSQGNRMLFVYAFLLMLPAYFFVPLSQAIAASGSFGVPLRLGIIMIIIAVAGTIIYRPGVMGLLVILSIAYTLALAAGIYYMRYYKLR